jgi:hypothetical protein
MYYYFLSIIYIIEKSVEREKRIERKEKRRRRRTCGLE